MRKVQFKHKVSNVRAAHIVSFFMFYSISLKNVNFIVQTLFSFRIQILSKLWYYNFQVHHYMPRQYTTMMNDRPISNNKVSSKNCMNFYEKFISLSSNNFQKVYQIYNFEKERISTNGNTLIFDFNCATANHYYHSSN